MKKLMFIIIVFLFIGGYMIKTTYDLNLEKSEDQKTFFAKFVTWLFQLGGNIKDLTGQAVEQEWLPNNETDKTFVIFDK